MKRLRLLRRLSDQRGFTLIEYIVSLVIVAIISLGATMTNAQIIEQTSKNSNYTTAGRQTLNAMHWISADVQMAQVLQPGPEGGFPLTLQWVEWDNTIHQVVYTLDNNKIRRSYSINGTAPVESLVAYHINEDTDLTNCVSDNGVLTLTVTGSVGEGAWQIDLTRVREIASRPMLRQ